jgi:hypothetical protein
MPTRTGEHRGSNEWRNGDKQGENGCLAPARLSFITFLFIAFPETRFWGINRTFANNGSY